MTEEALLLIIWLAVMVLITHLATTDIPGDASYGATYRNETLEWFAPFAVVVTIILTINWLLRLYKNKHG